MPSQMVFGQLDEIWSWSRGSAGEDLWVNIVAQLLHADIVVSGRRVPGEGGPSIGTGRFTFFAGIVSSWDDGRPKCPRLA
jgi:hypothetical protein